MKKPYINLMRYSIKRSWWNPLRYILGEWTTTSNAKKAWKQVKFNASDITISSQKRNPVHTLIMQKELEKWWVENPQMLEKLKTHFEKNYE